MPAITARFTADVSDFRAKLATATTEVTGFQKTASQVNNELKKFGNEFSGANVIRAAESMAKAVEDIGGVTKLTEIEQRKLTAAVSDAIDKYAALGQQAPAHLQTLKAETDHALASAKALGGGVKETEGSLLSFKGVASTLGGVVAGAFTVGALTGFAKEVIDLAGDIADLSSRTGISTSAIQELKYAADLTGATLDTMTGAIEQMGNRLTEGNDGTVAAVRSLGLSLEDLRSRRPEDAFTSIADAIKEVPDPMRQTQLAMELFGKSGAELLPAIKSGISDLRDEAQALGLVMSKEAVAGLDQLGDKWTTFIGRAKSGVGELISELKEAADKLKDLLPKVADPRPPDRFNDLTLAREFLDPKTPDAPGAPTAFIEGLREAKRAQDDFTLSQREFGGVAAATLELWKKQDEAAKRHAEQIQALRDQYSGDGIVRKLNDLSEAFRGLDPSQQTNLRTIKALLVDYEKFRSEVDPSRLPRNLEQLRQKHVDLTFETKEWSEALKVVPGNINAVIAAAGKMPNTINGFLNDLQFGDLGTELSNVKLGIGEVGLKADNADKQFKQWIDNSRRDTKLWGIDLRSVFSDMSEGFSGHLALMLTNQEGWKAGAVGIWHSFRDGVTDILGSILDSFINSFLKGITNALLGESGGWGEIFADAFTGGGGGGGGAGSNLAGSATNNLTNRAVNWGLGALGVGGATATAVPGITATTSAFSAGVPSLGIGAAASAGTGAGTAAGTTAGTGAATGGTFGGLTTAGVLGGAAAGGAGLGLGLLGTKIFGGAGWKASGFGAASGAATGALIGSVVPGIGTAVGAIVGGLAGAIGGWIGDSVGEKVNNARDEFLFQKDDQGRQVFGGSGTGEGSAFFNLSTDLAKVQGGDKLFTNLIKADGFKELNSAVKAIVDTLAGAEFNTIKVREGFDALTKQREALLALGADETAVLETQAGSYSLLFDTIKKTGAEVPEAMLPIFKSLIDMGLLVDENGAKVTSLADVAFGRLTASASAFGTDTKAAFEEVSRQLDDFVEKGFLSAEQADEMRKKFKGMDEGADAVGETADEVEALTGKVIVSSERAAELRKQLLEQENAHTTIEGSEQRIQYLTEALRDAEAAANDTRQALERMSSVPPPSVPTYDGYSAGPSGLQGAAHGIYAWGPTPAVFGEGGEPELGGSVGFMSKALAGALRQGGVSLDALAMASYRSQASSDRPMYLVADGMMLARLTNRYQPSALRLQGAIR
jgi:predicted  nucleic acid-binding Zn-ribbon protein